LRWFAGIMGCNSLMLSFNFLKRKSPVPVACANSDCPLQHLGEKLTEHSGFSSHG
jgi:hypothetical protein